MNSCSGATKENMTRAVQGATDAGDPLPTWDNIRGLSVRPSAPIVRSDLPWVDQHKYFYLAKTLAIADAADATYAPTTEGELSLLRAKASQLRSQLPTNAFPESVLHDVARLL